ncbi:MAG: DUF1015 domain-containing protein [Nocardioidaceae bacterium]
MAEPDAHPTPKLRLRPFAAMRFNPALVDDIGKVTCPPYDVMDRAMIEDLLASHPRNIVRLILPRLVHEPLAADDPYIAAAKRLARWRRQTTLLTDSEPGLYVYEYGDAAHRVCGIVAAVELHKPDSGVILPHEGVIPAIVADRLAMMVAARANLEPILLVYDGDETASACIASARERPPLTDVVASDGTYHRVWSITDPATMRLIRTALKPHQALIADGHHRYAMYQQLRRRHRSIGDGPGPWDRGLALIIDQSVFPLQLGAIHRSIAEVSLAALRPPPGFEWVESRRLDGRVPRLPRRSGELVVTDGVLEQTLRLPASGGDVVTDVEQLHEGLLPAWSVTDDRLGYHHTVPQTLHSAHQEGGVAILLHPTTVADVMTIARSGKIMPHKSTSFGPKPRMGLVMRAFDDES